MLNVYLPTHLTRDLAIPFGCERTRSKVIWRKILTQQRMRNLHQRCTLLTSYEFNAALCFSLLLYRLFRFRLHLDERTLRVCAGLGR